MSPGATSLVHMDLVSYLPARAQHGLLTHQQALEAGLTPREIARLVLSEASRFPKIAALYHREVVTRGVALMRHIAQRAIARGEFASDEIARFPHLVFAPALLALVWKTLFERFDPLDAEGMLDAHVTVIMRAMKAKP